MLMWSSRAIGDKDQRSATAAEVPVACLVVIGDVRMHVETVRSAYVHTDSIIHLDRVASNDGRTAETGIAHELHLSIAAFRIELHALVSRQVAIPNGQRAIRSKGMHTKIVGIDRRVRQSDVTQLGLDQSEQGIDRHRASSIIPHVHIPMFRDQIQLGR